MSDSLAIRVTVGAAQIDTLGRLAGARRRDRMMLSHALCWIGQGEVGAAVRAAVKGRGTMLEEHHRIVLEGSLGDAPGSTWDVAAEVSPAGSHRIVVGTAATSDACGRLATQVSLLALGDAALPPRRPIPARPARLLRSLSFTPADIDAYATLSGDDNALHLDVSAANRAGLPARVVHGALAAAAVEAAVVEEDGPGIPLVEVSVRFTGVLLAGEALAISARDMGRHGERHIVRAFAAAPGDLPVCTADFAFLEA